MKIRQGERYTPVLVPYIRRLKQAGRSAQEFKGCLANTVRLDLGRKRGRNEGTKKGRKERGKGKGRGRTEEENGSNKR